MYGAIFRILLNMRNEAIKSNSDFQLKRWISNSLPNHQIVSEKDDMRNKRFRNVRVP